MVSWDFLLRCLDRLGFNPRVVERFKTCLSTVSFKVRINKTLTTTIQPNRGLRQGDPPAPYLYLICGEAFNRYLIYLGESKKILQPKIIQKKDRIGLFQYADDQLIFLMVKETSATQLNIAMYLFEREAGQKVNKDKSTIMFSKGTNPSLAIKSRDSLNIHSTVDHI